MLVDKVENIRETAREVVTHPYSFFSFPIIPRLPGWDSSFVETDKSKAKDPKENAIASEKTMEEGKVTLETVSSSPEVDNAFTGPGFLAKNGKFFPVRSLTAEDADMLYEFFTIGLSDESRRTRFLSPTPNLRFSAAWYLANRDGRKRVALISFDPEASKIVGVAEYALTEDNIPEVAVAVADAYQGNGIGKNLIQMLSTLSLAGGYKQWKADLYADNGAVSHVLEHVGDIVLLSESQGVRSIRIDLDPAIVLATGLPEGSSSKDSNII